MKLFAVRKFDWVYKPDKKTEAHLESNCTMLTKAISKFRPVFFLQHDWKVFQSIGAYMGVILFVTQVNLVDLGNFFAKFILAIPPEHDLLKVRLFIMAHIAVSSAEEQFEYISNSYVKRLGPHAWTGVFILMAEYMFIFKNHTQFSSNPFPTWVVFMWASIGLMTFFGLIWVWLRNRNNPKLAEYDPYDPPIDVKAKKE